MSLDAWRCPNGHLHTPHHTKCRECGEPMDDRVDLTDRQATVISWTVSRSTPPGVRDPNPLAIVEFEVDGETVSMLGGLTTDDITSGDVVVPVYVEELRDPSKGIRHADSQRWDGYRFEPR